jgi:hypothetical protein
VAEAKKNYMQAFERIKSASLLMLTIKILSMQLYECKKKKNTSSKKFKN